MRVAISHILITVSLKLSTLILSFCSPTLKPANPTTPSDFFSQELNPALRSYSSRRRFLCKVPLFPSACCGVTAAIRAMAAFLLKNIPPQFTCYYEGLLSINKKKHR